MFEYSLDFVFCVLLGRVVSWSSTCMSKECEKGEKLFELLDARSYALSSASVNTSAFILMIQW